MQASTWLNLSLVALVLATTTRGAAEEDATSKPAPGLSIRFGLPALGEAGPGNGETGNGKRETEEASSAVNDSPSSNSQSAISNPQSSSRPGGLRPARIDAVKSEVRPPAEAATRATKSRNVKEPSATAASSEPADPLAVHIEKKLPVAPQQAARSSRRTASPAPRAGSPSSLALRVSEAMPLPKPLAGAASKRTEDRAQSMANSVVHPIVVDAREPVTAEFEEEVELPTKASKEENLAPIVSASDFPRPSRAPRNEPVGTDTSAPAAPKTASPPSNRSSAVTYPSTATPAAPFLSMPRLAVVSAKKESLTTVAPPVVPEVATAKLELRKVEAKPAKQSASESTPSSAEASAETAYASSPYTFARQVSASKETNKALPAPPKSEPKLLDLPKLIKPPKLLAPPNTSAASEERPGLDEKPAELLVKPAFVVAPASNTTE